MKTKIWQSIILNVYGSNLFHGRKSANLSFGCASLNMTLILRCGISTHNGPKTLWLYEGIEFKPSTA